MARTTFSGPVKSGTVREGASANTGDVVLVQTGTITSAATTATLGILPANAEIIGADVLVLEAFNDSTTNTISVGTSSTAAQYLTSVGVSTVGMVALGTAASTANWSIGSSDQTVLIQHDGTTVTAGNVKVMLYYRQT